MAAPFIVPKELESPVRSARLLALQKVFFEGSSEEVLTALELRELLEEDEECRLLVKQATQAVRRRLGKVGREIASPPDPSLFQQKFLGAGPKDRLRLLEDLDTIQRGALAIRAPDWLAQESDPAVMAALLMTFGEFWPPDRLEQAIPQVDSPSMTIRLAALDLLIRRAPQLIQARLDALAGDGDPGLRALAIRGLFSLDAGAALSHLSNMLLSPDPPQRRTGLNVCLALPFDKVKPLALQFIAVENDLELVEHAGYYFKVNPDVDSPYRLWEIAEESSPEKAAVLKRILQGTCEAISEAHLFEEDRKFHEYYQQLQEWIFRKAASRFVQDCIARLSQPDGADNPELTEAALRHLRTPLVRAAFEEALGWPIPETVRQRIATWLQVRRPAESSPAEAPSPPPSVQAGTESPVPPSNTPPSPVPPPATVPATGATTPAIGPGPLPESPPSLDEDFLKQAATWEKGDLSKARPALLQMLSIPTIAEKTRGALIRTALRLEIPGFEEICRGWLKSPNEVLVATAIEYLARFDPDGLFPLIGQFFRQPSQRILNAAIKALQKADQAQAVSYLLALLKDRQPAMQKMALGCMVYIDFSLVRERLAAFLRETHSQEMIEATLCLFMANPEPENLPLLAQAEKLLPPNLSRLLTEVRTKTEDLLVRYGRLPTPATPTSAPGQLPPGPSTATPPGSRSPGPAASTAAPTATPAVPANPVSTVASATTPGLTSAGVGTRPHSRAAPVPSGPPAPPAPAGQPPSRPTAAMPATRPAGASPSSGGPSRKTSRTTDRLTPEPTRWWQDIRVILASAAVILILAFFGLMHAFTAIGSSDPDSQDSSLGSSTPRTTQVRESGPGPTRDSLYDDFRRMKKRPKAP